MYGYGFEDYMNTTTSTGDAGVWMIISIVTAIIGGIALYFTFLADRNENSFKGFLGKVYDFLKFKVMTAEALLKITYLIAAIYITLMSFSYIGYSFLSFLGILTLGNLSLRLIYEFLIVTLMICRNTTEINKKLKKDGSKKEEK